MKNIDGKLKVWRYKMPTAAELLAELDSCPLGKDGWQQFENVGTEILKFTLELYVSVSRGNG